MLERALERDARVQRERAPKPGASPTAKRPVAVPTFTFQPNTTQRSPSRFLSPARGRPASGASPGGPAASPGPGRPFTAPAHRAGSSPLRGGSSPLRAGSPGRGFGATAAAASHWGGATAGPQAAAGPPDPELAHAELLRMRVEDAAAALDRVRTPHTPRAPCFSRACSCHPSLGRSAARDV